MLKEIGTSSQSDNLQLFSLQSQMPKQSVRRIICPAESSIMTTSSVCLFGKASQSDTLIRSPLAAMCTANLYGHLPSCVPALKKVVFASPPHSYPRPSVPKLWRRKPNWSMSMELFSPRPETDWLTDKQIDWQELFLFGFNRTWVGLCAVIDNQAEVLDTNIGSFIHCLMI